MIIIMNKCYLFTTNFRILALTQSFRIERYRRHSGLGNIFAYISSERFDTKLVNVTLRNSVIGPTDSDR